MKKRIGKMLSLLAVFGLLLALFGCGGNDAADQLLSVTFMSHDDIRLTTKFVLSGMPVSRPFVTPDREAWTFTRWYTKRIGGEIFDFNAPITQNTTVWAGWTQTPRTVTFMLQGGNWAHPGNSAVVHKGDPIGRPADPVREGFFFDGWFDSYFGGAAWDFDTPIVNNTILWARWTRAVRVTFDLAGGNWNTHHVIYIRQGTTIGQIPLPTKTGRPAAQGLFHAPTNGWNNIVWAFRGWYSEGSAWTLTDPVHENVNLTAQWASPYGGPIHLDDLAPFPVSNFIQRAFYYMDNNPGTYYLFLGENLRVPELPPDLLPMAPIRYILEPPMAGAVLRNSSVTLIGLEEMRTITRGGLNGALFMVRNGASLTLGENITLSGDPNFASNAGLLFLYGATTSAYMLEGSKITNHRQGAHLADFNAPVIARYATFTMKGGIITGNNSVTGSVFVDDGTFYMKGGKITNNSSTDHGTVRIIWRGRFNMEAGQITGNSSNVAGGVFLNHAAAAFNMNGGQISNNTVSGSMSGGGISVSAGTVNLNAGQIFGNTTTVVIGSGIGGGVRVSGANSVFNMNGGQIFNNVTNGNSATMTNAGGVSVTSAAVFNMNSGEIFGNTANGPHSAGGVTVNPNAHFNMRGGAIFGNRAFGDNSAGGLRTLLGTGAANWGTTRISGGKIYGNEAAVPEERRNIAAGAASGAALRSLAPANNRAEHGRWTWNPGTEVYDWTLVGSFTAGAAADAPLGIYNSTIHVINGVLQGQ